MSRSALWRQEGNVKERERQAEELFALAVEEGRVSVTLRWNMSADGIQQATLTPAFFNVCI
jgi:hypothetical protein